MANPKELLEAAEAVRDVRRLPAVQRHQQIEDLLHQAEEWARREYCKVSENDDQNARQGDKGHNREFRYRVAIGSPLFCFQSTKRIATTPTLDDRPD